MNQAVWFKLLEMKNSFLSEKIREDFFIMLYFNVSLGYEDAGLKRAYLDFNRTLKIKDKNVEKRKSIQSRSQEQLKLDLRSLINGDFRTQEEFDIEHERLSVKHIKQWDELSFGQIQKWINMTLKYWLLLGESRIRSIEKNARFFHIPIDSYVLNGMFKKPNAKPWSKISSYKDYFNYQLLHREKNTGNAPIIDEFEFFNEFSKQN